MSIPDRFLRIAKHKLGELKDWFDQIDEEREERSSLEAERRRARTEARRELDEGPSMPTPSTNTPPQGERSAIPMQPPPVRTPDEILRGIRPDSLGAGRSAYPASTAPTAARSATSAQTPPPDPLDYQYRLLGLEPGADFASIQTAYNRLAARCDPSRFPAGSQDEQTARELRQRLDTSYKLLRDALDTTARRFDLLEFDAPAPPNTSGSIIQKVDEQPRQAGN